MQNTGDATLSDAAVAVSDTKYVSNIYWSIDTKDSNVLALRAELWDTADNGAARTNVECGNINEATKKNIIPNDYSQYIGGSVVARNSDNAIVAFTAESIPIQGYFSGAQYTTWLAVGS